MKKISPFSKKVGFMAAGVACLALAAFCFISSTDYKG